MAEAKRPRGRPPKTAATKGRKYNPKSRDNLRQYNVTSAKDKKQLVKSIAEEIEVDIPEEMLEVIIPTKKVFKDKEERERFALLLKLSLKEISSEEKLTFSDIRAMAELCKNTILEDRLLENSNSPATLVDVMTPVEKLKKRNATLLDTLATNRSARIDPRQGKDITVMDVLYTFDDEVQEDFQDKLLKRLESEEDKVKGLVKTSNKEMIT
jgi:hypothetical protein